MILIDNKKYADRILSGEKTTINFKFIDGTSFAKINVILLKTLSRQNNLFLLETIITIIKEIIFNAFKANLKKIYFTESGVEIIEQSRKYNPLTDAYNDAHDATEGTGRELIIIIFILKILSMGSQNLTLILTASDSKKILNDEYKKFEVIWKQHTRIAYYAKLITKKNKLTNLANLAFITGLLQDIGKIVLLAINSDIISTISKINQSEQIRKSSLLKKISIRISHSRIVKFIAKKWNFPKKLKISINNHHSPLNAYSESKDFTFSIYLANMLSGIETNKYDCCYLATDVLKWLNITTLKESKGVFNELNKNFKKHIFIIG